MRFVGSLLAVVTLLTSAACSRDIAGKPTADVGQSMPARESSEAPTTSERSVECTDCDRDTVEATIEKPAVAQAKRVDTPPDCATIMPLSTISQVVDATAHPSRARGPNECHAAYETADLSRSGVVLVEFSSPVSIEPVAISEFKGNTLLESAISNQSCEYGLAINDALDEFDHGSWLTLRVMSANGNPAPCGPARQLVEIAFGNLPEL